MWCEAPAIRIITTPRQGKRPVVRSQCAPAYQIARLDILTQNHELSYTKTSTDSYSILLFRYTKPAASVQPTHQLFRWCGIRQRVVVNPSGGGYSQVSQRGNKMENIPQPFPLSILPLSGLLAVLPLFLVSFVISPVICQSGYRVVRWSSSLSFIHHHHHHPPPLWTA